MADDILIRILNNLAYQVPQVEGMEKIKEITPRPEVVHEGSPPSEHIKEERKKKEDKRRQKKEGEEKKEEEGVDIVI